MDWEKDIVLVSLGAIPGALLRIYLVKTYSNFLPRKYLLIMFINILASFGVGIISAINISGLMLFFGVGFLGSFSTFSTFIMDVFDGLIKKRFVESLCLSVSSFTLALMACAFGVWLKNG